MSLLTRVSIRKNSRRKKRELPPPPKDLPEFEPTPTGPDLFMYKQAINNFNPENLTNYKTNDETLYQGIYSEKHEFFLVNFSDTILPTLPYGESVESILSRPITPEACIEPEMDEQNYIYTTNLETELETNIERTNSYEFEDGLKVEMPEEIQRVLLENPGILDPRLGRNTLIVANSSTRDKQQADIKSTAPLRTPSRKKSLRRGTSSHRQNSQKSTRPTPIQIPNQKVLLKKATSYSSSPYAEKSSKSPTTPSPVSKSPEALGFIFEPSPFDAISRKNPATNVIQNKSVVPPPLSGKIVRDSYVSVESTELSDDDEMKSFKSKSPEMSDSPLSTEFPMVKVRPRTIPRPITVRSITQRQASTILLENNLPLNSIMMSTNGSNDWKKNSVIFRLKDKNPFLVMLLRKDEANNEQANTLTEDHGDLNDYYDAEIDLLDDYLNF